MKLYLNHDLKYPVEQMMFSLLPGELPVYTDEPPQEEDTVLFSTLSFSGGRVTATAVLRYQGKRFRRRAWACSSGWMGELEQKRVLSRIVRLSFYRAAADALGKEPPWGALTGVRPAKIPVKAMEQGMTTGQAERLMREVYRVSPDRCRLVMDCARACLDVKRTLAPDEISLYIGIPFCPSRCAYCSFISADVGRSLQLVEPFLEGLLQEIQAAGVMLKRTGKAIRSIYIGGGTPTTLSAAQLSRLMEQVGEKLDLSRCTEYTVEAGRPDTITPEKLAVIRSFGAGRISVNPQSMEHSVLRAMGRPHTPEDILQAYAMVRQAGTFAVNMDLIAGLPGDTPEGFRRSLETVLNLAPENITVHTLALKKGSALMTGDGHVILPSEAQVEEMLKDAGSRLSAAGYRPYYLYRQKYMSGSFENVGWCKPGQQSVYNICMMEELHPVLALGGGGVTKLVDPLTGAIRRMANPKYPKEYLDQLPQILTEKEQMTWRIN